VNDVRSSGAHVRSAFTNFGRPGWRPYQSQAASATPSNSLTSTNSAAAGADGGAGAYHAVFGAAVPFMVLARILALVMPEKPLSEEMIEVAVDKAEVPEY
jgi:hypothetical protein